LPDGKAFSFLFFFEKGVTFGRLETLYIKRRKRRKEVPFRGFRGRRAEEANSFKRKHEPPEGLVFLGSNQHKDCKKSKKN